VKVLLRPAALVILVGMLLVMISAAVIYAAFGWKAELYLAAGVIGMMMWMGGLAAISASESAHKVSAESITLNDEAPSGA
jgi:hypothetical protein